jgi:hypothetical protein
MDIIPFASNKEPAMKIFQIALLVIAIASEIAIFTWGIRLSQKVFWGQITSGKKQIEISILSGIPVGLLFIIMALIAGILDANFKWTIGGIVVVVIIGFILFVLGTVGAIWRFFIAGKVRSRLFTKLKSVGKDR